MPVTHRKSEVILHAFAKQDFIGVIVAETGICHAIGANIGKGCVSVKKLFVHCCSLLDFSGLKLDRRFTVARTTTQHFAA
jgi:hypothetical protein